jgi:hypothetical protein
MSPNSDFVVILASRDGRRQYTADDELVVGVVRDLIRSGAGEVIPTPGVIKDRTRHLTLTP